MDPTIELCAIYSSKSYSIIVKNNSSVVPYFYPNLRNIQYEEERDKKIENKENIFKNISPNRITSIRSLILSNIDAVYNFTGRVGGGLLKQNLRRYIFLCRGEESFQACEYILFRLPAATGVIYSKEEMVLDSVYVRQNEHYLNVIKNNKTNFPMGVDFIYTDVNLKELLISLLVVRNSPQSTLIMKLNLDKTGMYNNTLLLLTKAFNKVSLFKPLSSYDENSIYIIATKINRFYKDIIKIIREYINNSDKRILVNRDLLLYITEIKKQLVSQNNLDLKNPHMYDLSRCNILWNI